MKLIFVLVLISFSAAAQMPAVLKQLTVAKDGSGNFLTVQEAVNAVGDNNQQRTTIYIKKGIYTEKLTIPAQKAKISFIGEDRAKTIITYNDYSGNNGVNTFTSHTVFVQGNDFIATNLTFENSAGPVGQAVALHVEADRVIIKNCNIIGNQDTLFPSAATSRQYYVNCYIEGTTDFIFGAATAVFEHCIIQSKKNSYVTAASTSQTQQYGFVFFNCKLIADVNAQKVYLGRPWKPYAKTVFINTEMGNHILPEGWHVWNQNENHKTTFYAEYGSSGPGFVKERRVPWSKQLTKQEKKEYTLANIFKDWNPKEQSVKSP